MPPRYSPTDEPPAETELARTAVSARLRVGHLLAAVLAVAAVILVAGGLRGRRP